MAKARTEFFCKECGGHSPKWLGKCPHCNTWDSMVEDKVFTQSSKNSRYLSNSMASPVKITDIDHTQRPRIKTEYDELNRALGGGIVYGSLILLGGDPGIGKSTLLLQVSKSVSASDRKVLYISGEESSEQIKLRAERLKINTQTLYIYCETEIEKIIATITKERPDFVIVDSIQTVYHGEVNSAPGNVSQVRECTMSLLKVAKNLNIPIFIVGHVTKDGAIAGPRMLEHMVDTVLYFEGEKHHSFRILRSVKNRFGATNEIGIFEMKEEGLSEVTNPSMIFLEDRVTDCPGACVVSSMEGTRPMLVEIQSLLTPTNFGNPKRMTSGVDHNRLSLLLAVVEKKLGHLLQTHDAYIKVTGGVKLTEPAIDLAILVSVLSSFKNTIVNVDDVYIGEVGLTGEIRRVTFIQERVKEAAKLGFKRAIVPQKNIKDMKKITGIEVVGVSHVNELEKVLFNNKNDLF